MAKIHHSSDTPSHHKRRQPGRTGPSNIKTWSIVALAIVLVAGAYLLLRPRNALASEVQPAQAYELYKNGATFVDVRTQAEWDQGHIARSLLIPLDELPNRLNELPHDKDIVVVCRSGARNKEGASILRQAGFTHVTCLSGGLQAWVAAGYPITQ